MKSLRILVLAPDCNPESVGTPSIAFAQAVALARLHDVTMVVRAVNADKVRQGKGGFASIVPIRLPVLDRLYAWALRRIFKYDYGRQSLTAATYPLQIAFEWRAWRTLRSRIHDGDFDVVLRILPIVSVLPSPFAVFLSREPVPFVIGPLNGGLPWPDGFPQLEKQRRAAGYWVARARNLYRYLPFGEATYSKATAIIAGSSHTYAEFDVYRDKLFFVPGENGIDPTVFQAPTRPAPTVSRQLQLVFVGRLIPLKACDIALKGAAELLRAGRAHFTVVGDGAERAHLAELTRSLGIEQAVTFTGWLSTADTMAELQRADALVFPSLREFGGAVVFEALALGVVPIVADFGGPGDIVTPEVGYKVPLTNEHDMTERVARTLKRLDEDRDHLQLLSRQGVAYAHEHLTWDGKARTVSAILYWATGRGPKPAHAPHSLSPALET